jgi:hypothetical protein
VKINRIIYASVLIVLISACTKVSDENPNNFIQAKIGNDIITVYENASLNTDTVPKTFSFSFGQRIATVSARKDTNLFINVSLNRQSFEICFPKSANAQTFNIYRISDIMLEPSAYYMKVQKVTPPSGNEIFYTRNLINKDNTDSEKVGEITVSRIDMQSRELEGTFNFKAYGYTQISLNIKPTSETVNVTDGKFYYHWTKDLGK